MKDVYSCEMDNKILDILDRLEYLKQEEPQLIDFIHRTIEGLVIVDKNTLKIESNNKLNLLRCIQSLKNNKAIESLYKIGNRLLISEAKGDI